MISIEALTFAYARGDFRLVIPELVIENGVRVAVIGPSGSGKTTFLNLVSGIAIPGTGRVRVGEHDIAAMSDAARRDFRLAHVGFVFQDFELLDYLDVFDNILHLYRIGRSLTLTTAVRDRARELAAQTGLADKLRRHPDELSHGERQRAAICRALLPGPDVILADEPTGNLDPPSKERIMNLLSTYATGHAATLITVTHDHTLLDGFDRVIDFSTFHGGRTP
jgi:putative ABC transport system ATP-binding protein